MSLSLTIKPAVGEPIVVDVKFTDTVESLQARVSDLTFGITGARYPLDTQRLILKGESLRRELTFEKCGVEDGCVLHVAGAGIGYHIPGIGNQQSQKEERSFGKDDNCAICFETMETPCKLPCGHWYCSLCVDKLKASPTLKQSCPTCRAPLTPPKILAGAATINDLPLLWTRLESPNVDDQLDSLRAFRTLVSGEPRDNDIMRVLNSGTLGFTFVDILIYILANRCAWPRTPPTLSSPARAVVAASSCPAVYPSLRTCILRTSNPPNPLRYASPYPEHQHEAAWALTNVASTDHTAVVVERGAVPFLVERLRDPMENMREQCAWCLANVSARLILPPLSSLHACSLMSMLFRGP